ncbi:MAG: pyridoxal phosphate-dependent aminotransferase [Fimbriimonadaceae bacterium]|nr:pyridoxal phosphate-dependent aminotransferase [Fimbriimonadaceae bacterium]
MALPLSRRAKAMPASPIRKLAPYADAAKKLGVKVYHLNIGQPDVPSPAQFWDAVKSSNLQVLEYSNSAGIAELREKVAADYRKNRIDVSTDEVIITTAGSESLNIALNVICNEGDEVIVPEPLYANYIGFAAGTGINVVPIPTKIEDNFALPPSSEFAKRVTDRTKAIIICNPGNPTGTIYSKQQLEELISIANEHNLYVIADEVYREFAYDGVRPVSVLQLAGTEQNAIMVDSVSKRYSLCGARIGFFVTKNKEIMDAAVRFAQARLSSPTLEMIGVIGALDTPQSYFDDLRLEYTRRRDLLVSRLRAMPGVTCPDIHGAFYATVRLPIDDSDRFCQWMLEEFRHNNSTVMMAPGTGFYSTKGCGLDEVRIAYVLNLEDLGKAMDCLEIALQTYPGRTLNSPVAAGN